MLDRSSFPSTDKHKAFVDALRHTERATTAGGPLLVIPSGSGPLVALREVVAFFAACDWPNIPAPLLEVGKIGPTPEEPVPIHVKSDPTPAMVVSDDSQESALSLVTHKTKRRADPLAAVLTLAAQRALDPTDWQSVWAALVALAEPATRPAPLLGYVEREGVQYRADDAEQPASYLSRNALRKRFSRKG